MNTEQLISELPNGLIGWYPFEKDKKALYIIDNARAFLPFVEVLESRQLDVDVLTSGNLESQTQARTNRLYDYIVIALALEKSRNPQVLLSMFKNMLTNDGKLLAVVNNRFGIRYFCGDKDVYTRHVLDSIDDYSKVSAKRKEEIGGRAYDKAQWKHMLMEAGFRRQKFYSVMPSIMRPQMLVSEDYTPNEALDIRVFPQYNSPQTVFLEEEKLYADLLRNGMFHPMANGFLIECSVDGELEDADQITISGDRGHVNSLVTVIRKGKSVSKKALYQEGREKVSELIENSEYLKEHHVPMVEARSEDDSFVMPYVKGEIVTLYFRELLKKNRELFLAEFSHFREIILNSSEPVPYSEVNWRQFEPGWEKRKVDDPNIDQWRNRAFGSKEEQDNIGIILKKGFIDLVSLNCFYTEQGYLFFDQEFYVDNLPANVILVRTIDLIYRDCPDIEQLLPREEVFRYFKLWEYLDTWRRFTSRFMEMLRSERQLVGYHKLCRRDWNTVVANRHRMDYTQEEYERLFKDIFKGAQNKKIYLFGSGRYAEQFIEQFGKYYNIEGLLDNNRDRWGSNLKGIPIMEPQRLCELEGPYKVFICIKFFEDVLEQLKEMGVMDISIYDPRLDYDRPVRIVEKITNSEPKQYHIGYVAGVFDLFHKGHLNLLRRAKEQCDYLIVGVVSDEQVIKSKKTSPYIPFEERREIVQACKYVDEAVEIPVNRPSTEDAWRMYHFDAQFSGSDYANDPVWLAKKTFLQQHGSDLVFFPYTESTSSTMLKEKISKGK
ncbi:MAG: adenylyltransferase/cytidyltransferase family protein [Lachnospiraceae bacterium]